MFVEPAWTSKRCRYFITRDWPVGPLMADAIAWCEEQFGPESVTTWESASDDEISVYNPDFAVAFKMRWC
ncbi:MAG: hypothetical protein EOO77_39605 [Oxalobacteraceae bacterium]|nr:MAG: hypothetical protein EOO77_39605 [Oxalobacteraceae bacterium]